MLVVIYLIPAFLALAIIAWVYFDATELGKPAIPWAIAQPVLWWLFFLPLILYLIFREQGQRRSVPPGGARRQSVYIVSFIGYSFVAYGFAAVLAILIVSTTTHIGDTIVRDVISSSVASIIVGGAMWAVAWLPAERNVEAIGEDAEFRATFYLHRAYIYTIVGTALLVAAVFGLWFLAGMVSSLSGTGDVKAEAWTWTLGPLLVAAAAIGAHFQLYLNGERYRRMLKRFESIPAPLLVGVPVQAAAPGTQASPAGQQFCRHCGREVGTGDAFCRACGTATATS